MTAIKTTKRNTLSALVLVVAVAGALSGCGADSPQEMLISAKQYLSKQDVKAATIQLKNALQADPKLAEARFLLGKTLLATGNAVGAELELRKALELNYSTDEVYPLLARTLLSLGQTQKVVDELASVRLASAPAKADLATMLAQAYLITNRLADARTVLAAAVAAVPDYGPALVGQARVKAIEEDLPGALTLLDATLGKDPSLYEGWHLKGDVLIAQGDANGAIDAYRKAVATKPDYLPAHFSLVSRLLSSGQVDDAEKQLAVMEKVAAGNPQTHYLRAQLALNRKDLTTARTEIQQFLKVAPDNVAGLQLAGAIEYGLKSYAMAESNLLKVLQKTPAQGIARRMLIATYLRDGQPVKAMATLQPVLDKIDQNSDFQALAGYVFMMNGRSEEAEVFFARASALDPDNSSKKTAVAFSHLATGDVETASRELEEIVASDSGVRADIALIAAQLRNSQFDQALASVATFESKQPDNPLADNFRGVAYLGKRDLVAARKSFEQSLAKNPSFVSAAKNLANLDLAERKPEDAKKRFAAILEKDPKNVSMMLAFAEVQARSGSKVEDIAALINKAVATDPTDPAPRIALVKLYLAGKDAKQALLASQSALGAFPDNPEILDLAGRAQQAAGEGNQALATYGKLATRLPNSPLAYLRMAEILAANNDKDGAMQSLRKALSVKSDSVEAQRGIIMLDLDVGRFDEALSVTATMQKQRPNEAVGYLLEGDVHSMKKSWKKAVTAYRNGLEHSAASELAIKLHSVLLADGNGGEANAFTKSWMSKHPDDLRFQLYLAEAAGARKDYATASRYYQVILEAQPDNPKMLNNFAWTLAQLNDPKALDYAEKANKLAPEQPAIMDTLGGLLIAKGQVARGLELLGKAVTLAPQHATIRLNYAKALLKTDKKQEARKELEVLKKLGERFSEHAEVARLLGEP